jgi:hypothetical protein
MALAAGDSATSFFPEKKMVHLLSAGEVGSGEVLLTFSNDVLPTTDTAIQANVYSISGVPRTLTKVLYSKTTGILDVTGSSFATGDTLVVMGFKYYA